MRLRQTARVRVSTVPQLPDPGAAVRREPELGPARHHHTPLKREAPDQLSCPIIPLQGLDDQVVLPEQAEMMVRALDDKGIPYAYVPFEGEGHGFRRAVNIERAAEAELYFYARVFGFETADDLTPVEIHNEAGLPSQ